MSAKDNASECVALWMMARGYATGHGNTIEDMLVELEGQIREHCAIIAERWRSPYGSPRDSEVTEAVAEAIREDRDPKAKTGLPYR